MSDSLSPIPGHPGMGDEAVHRLQRARQQAAAAIIRSEEAQRVATTMKKRARSKVRAYERLVEEYNGQLQLPME